MYITMFVHMYVCVYVSTYVCISMREVQGYECMCGCVYIHNVHACMYTYVLDDMYISVHINCSTHVCIQKCIHVHKYTYV